MLKRGAGRVLDGALRAFDQQLTAQEVRDFVEAGYHRLACQGDLAEEARQDLRLLEGLMAGMDWQTYGTALAPQVDRPSPEAFKDLTVENCYVRGVLQPGCGRYLDVLSGTGPQADACLEKLLRHVEVKRRKALRKFNRELSAEDQWLERCDVCILFSRFARRRKDLRFLNAAFKLNEWYFREISAASETVQVRQLLSLAEQEASAGELLAC
ncbi:MAG: hypothetical protein PWQ55_144 [Chloroflexota bacterium]|nr:hypothetical protein [Chloroflexota bacterium]